MANKASGEKKKVSGRTVIIVLVIAVLLAFIAGFFIYVRTWRLFPNMPGILDLMTGTDHFSPEDHVGLYELSNNEDISGYTSTQTDKLVLTKISGFTYDLQNKPVRIDTTSFKTYPLYPCDKPADVSLIFDSDLKLCGSEIVYHYTEDQMMNFDQDMSQVTYAVDHRLRQNVLFSIYATLADKLGFKRYNVMREGSAEDTHLVVQEFYRTHAYN